MIEVAHGMRIMQKHYRGLRTVDVLPNFPAGTGDHCPQNKSKTQATSLLFEKLRRAAREARRLVKNQIAKMTIGNYEPLKGCV
jgi:hypothetical protein